VLYVPYRDTWRIMVTNQTLSHEILKNRRQYYIEKVQAPLMKALVTLAFRYPEPTEQNVSHPNAKLWLRVWNKFLEMEDNPGRHALFEAIKRVFVGKSVEIDPYYRDREQVIHELWLDEVLEGHWKPRSPDQPPDCWKADSNERGIGYEFLKTMYYYPEIREKIKDLVKRL